MSGKAKAGNDLISHDSVNVRARLAIALRRRVQLRSELKSHATAPSSLDGHLVKQRESDPVTEETEIFVAETIVRAKLNEFRSGAVQGRLREQRR